MILRNPFRPMLLGVAAGAALTAGFAVSAGAQSAGQGTVVELTQVGCQFIESESGIDHGFMPKSAMDCNRINSRIEREWLEKAETLVLKPGTYTFRVFNKNVPYELGFWLRDKDYDWCNPLHKLSKISVSGGGLLMGKTQEYKVELKPGECIYSCPPNPTPNYRLVVQG